MPINFKKLWLCLFSLTEPETTQFFQFDRDGNMYVFAPGAGCTGPTQLVKPGDELIFNSSYNPSDWTSGNSIKVEEEDTFVAHTCPAGNAVAISQDFKEPLSNEDLVKLSHKIFSNETMKQIWWVRKMYHEWRTCCHAHGFEFIQCDLEDRATITAESLKFALCRFIMENKKISGKEFPGKTLYHIVVCMQFHLECLGFAFKLINDPAFRNLKFMLDNNMNARVSHGIGFSIKKADMLTSTDESSNHPDQLLNTVIYILSARALLYEQARSTGHSVAYCLPHNLNSLKTVTEKYFCITRRMWVQRPTRAAWSTFKLIPRPWICMPHPDLTAACYEPSSGTLHCSKRPGHVRHSTSSQAKSSLGRLGMWTDRVASIGFAVPLVTCVGLLAFPGTIPIIL